MNAKSKEAGYKVFVPKLTAKMLRSGFQNLLNMPPRSFHVAPKSSQNSPKIDPRSPKINTTSTEAAYNAQNNSRNLLTCLQQVGLERHPPTDPSLGSLADVMLKSARTLCCRTIHTATYSWHTSTS